MKLHLPIALRRAVLAVMAVLATSPAMAANKHVYTDTTYTLTDQVLNSNYDAVNGTSKPGYYERTGYYNNYTYKHHSHLEMQGTASNKIVSGDGSITAGYIFKIADLPGFILGNTNPNVTVNGNVTMTTTNGYNAIVGSVTGPYRFDILLGQVNANGGRPNVTAGGDVVMNGPANAVMLGSTINGTNITLENTGNQTTTIGKVLDGILGDYGTSFIPEDNSMRKIEGIFNIVQGSKLNATGSVTLNTATDTSVNKLKVNVITGGQGDISDVAHQVLTSMGGDVANAVGDIVDSIVEKAKENDFGSSITAGTDITMGGGASVIVDTTLSDLVAFSKDQTNLNALLVGGENNITPVKLDAGQNLNLDSIINMAYGARGGVNLSAGTADGVVGAINATGAFNIIGGKTTLEADAINLTPNKAVSVNQLIGELGQLGDLLPVNQETMKSLADNMGALAEQPISANIVAGGSQLTAEQNITTGGTLGLVVNTPVSSVMSSLMSYLGHQQETYMLYELLQPGTTTTITSANGSIELGSQLNLVHGGGFTETAGANALKISAANGTVNVQGTANVVSGNVEVKANEIKLTGERLPSDLAGVAGSVVDRVAEMLPDGAEDLAGGMLDKLVQKGNVNLVTGGATLEAGTGGITMSDIPVDAVGATGAINAVLDTELVGLVEGFMERDTESLIKGGSHQTTLKSDGDINMLGRVNVVNGGKVVLDAEGDVNLQGSASLISGGAKVDAANININTSTEEKYKMYFDSTELGGLDSPMAPIVSSISNMGVNAGIVTGGAKLTADQNITMGGTLGLVMNTPMADVMTELVSYLNHKQETWMVYQLLQKGTATTVTSTNGNIELGAQFNLAHGGNFAADGSTALKLSAANGAVNINGTLNVVSGNVTVDAQTINMNGERLPQDMAGVANSVIGIIAGDLVENNSGISGMLNKLVTKGNANMVVGGATLTASQGITMNGVANAVFDTEIVDLVEAFMERNTGSLEEGSNKLTTLHTTTGNIDLLGRLNMVNGSYVLLQADAGDVNLQGNMSLVSGGAKVNATNININTDESNKYKMYVDSDELGAIIPAGAPYTQLITQMGITDKLGHAGVNGSLIAGGAKLTATNNITTGGTVGLVLNTPMDEIGDRLMSLLTDPNHDDEIWMAYELLQKGTATTLNADNNIELGARMNVLHGGNMANANAALALTAGNTVKLDGTLNLVSGNVTVNAKDIELKGGQNVSLNLAPLVDKVMGSSEYAGLISGSGMLDKIATKGVNGNMVTGGATLTAQNNIKLDGMANFVLDTELTDVVEAVMERKPDAMVQGGSHKTTLTATNGNIDLLGRLNVVNGGQVELTAGQTVRLEGTANLISGNAKVSGKDIEMTGKNNVGLNWGELIPDKYAGYGELADKMGILDKVNSGVNGNVVAGGAKLSAENDISINGMAGAVVDTTLGSVVEAVQTMNGTPLLEGKTAETTLKAGGDINLNTRLNVVNGGKTLLDAGKDVNMGGTFNVVATNANVNAGGNINMNAKNKVGVDISPMLNGHYAELAEEMGMTEVLKDGVSSNIVAGGANLKAKGDVVMSGVATAIVDTTINNVIGAAKGNDLSSLMQGGRNTTTVTAENDIKLESQMNVVNGGNATKAGGVKLEAGRDVNIGGDISVINRATVKAGHDVNITSGKAVLKNASIAADGIVSFTNTNAEMTNGSISGAEVQVTNATLSNTADSTVTISDLVTVTENASIENYGSLTLSEAVITNSTLYSDSANTTVTGSLTLQSATLVYTAESLTRNETAIMLDGGKVLTNAPDSAPIGSDFDAIAGVNFVISSESLGKDAFSEGGAYFELALFEGGDKNTEKLVKTYLGKGEVSFTVYDTGWNATVSNFEVIRTDVGNIVITGNVSVPEPTTATLSLLALAALAGRRRRK